MVEEETYLARAHVRIIPDPFQADFPVYRYQTPLPLAQGKPVEGCGGVAAHCEQRSVGRIDDGDKLTMILIVGRVEPQ